jgi:hypothetical protein
LDALFDDIVEDPHHGHGLFFAESFTLQPLHELQRVEMMILLLGWRCGECSLGWLKGGDVDTIVPYWWRVCWYGGRLFSCGFCMEGWSLRWTEGMLG